jgi:AbiEi antitoxin C-terminal domain
MWHPTPREPSRDGSRYSRRAEEFPQIGLAAAVGWSGALRVVPMFPPAQAAAAFDPRQPFSRAEARAAGLTAEMLLSSRFHKICWDTYVARDVPITPLLRARAVIRLVPSGSHVSHHTAAELWGADPPSDRATHVTLPSACGRLVRRGVRSHYRKHPAQTTRRKGLPISTPEQTFLDLAAVGAGLVDLVVVADGLIKAGHTSPERLVETAAQHIRWRLVLVTSEGIYREPLRTLERVRDALLDCEAVGIRRTFKPEWLLHFPIR